MMKVQPPGYNSWDPLDHEGEQPSPECLLRVQKDIDAFQADPPKGIFISPESSDVTKIHVLVVGPAGTPYEGGFFQYILRCPPDYPLNPPRMRHLTTDAGRVRFSVNLYNSGKVCVSTLGTAYGPGWDPAYRLANVLVSVQSVMCEHPYFNGNYKEEKAGDSHTYDLFVRHETLRVAVCDQVESALKEDPQCPLAFRKQILQSFLESYGKYDDAVKAQLHLTGTEMKDAYSPSLVATFQFGMLLTRMQYLKQEVEKTQSAAEVAAQAAAQTAAEDAAQVVA